jgi:hypothetical protein
MSSSSAIDAYRQYYRSVIIGAEPDIRWTVLSAAIAATLCCLPEDQVLVEKQSVEDMNEATRCFKRDLDPDTATEQIRRIRSARANFDVFLCEGRLAAAKK